MAEQDPGLMDAADPSQVSAAKRPRRWPRFALMASLPLLLIAIAVGYYVIYRDIASTDNAYVRQDKVSVSPEITGHITQVFVRENQLVKAGDVLFTIDPSPYRIAVAQANAAIAGAQVNVTGLETSLGNAGVDIEAAAEDVQFYARQLRRQQELMQQGFTTRARLEAAEHDVSDAQSKLAEAQADARSARAALATSPAAPGANPAVAAALAARDKALLDLERSTIRAPVGGKITQSTRLQLGQMMLTGLPALTIVVSDQSWIEANFKETDLAHMRLGQPAVLTFDAYPDVKLRGHVASIGAGTGSESSILPAQNASGNWVKVTQRIPVRIAIDQRSPRALIAGLSSHVEIDTSK